MPKKIKVDVKKESLGLKDFSELLRDMMLSPAITIHKLKKQHKGDFIIVSFHTSCSCGRDDCIGERKTVVTVPMDYIEDQEKHKMN